jgi:hypothetical protein
LWTRVNPDEACRRGRVDILLFLYERNRVPRTTNPWTHAALCGSPAIVRLAERRRPLRYDAGRFIDTAKMALSHGHLNVALAACRSAGSNFDMVFRQACAQRGALLAADVWSAMTPTYRRAIGLEWLHIAAGLNRFDVVLAILDRDDDEKCGAWHHSDDGDAGGSDTTLAVLLARAVSGFAAAGSVSMLCAATARLERYAPLALQPACDAAFLRAAAAGHLDAVAHLWHVGLWNGTSNLGGALVCAARCGNASLADWLLAHVDRSRLDVEAALAAALRSAWGTPVLFSLVRHGVPVDFQRAFMAYAQRGQITAVKHLCSMVLAVCILWQRSGGSPPPPWFLAITRCASGLDSLADGAADESARPRRPDPVAGVVTRPLRIDSLATGGSDDEDIPIREQEMHVYRMWRCDAEAPARE